MLDRILSPGTNLSQWIRLSSHQPKVNNSLEYRINFHALNISSWQMKRRSSLFHAALSIISGKRRAGRHYDRIGLYPLWISEIGADWWNLGGSVDWLSINPFPLNLTRHPDVSHMRTGPYIWRSYICLFAAG